MKRTRILIIAALLSLAAIPALAQGVKLTPAGGNFSITFPGADQVSEKAETKTGTGASFPLTTHLFIQRDGDMVAVAGWVDYNPTYEFGARAEMIANRDNFLKGIGATLVSEKNIKLGVYDGMEFEGDMNGERTIKGRVFIVGKRPMLAIGLAPKGTRVSDMTAFLESFKLTK